MLSRVDATTDVVTATIRYGAAGQLGDFYDSAAYGFGSVWVASDEHGTVTRVDPATNQVTATIPVASRPAQITVTSDAVWVAHFLQPLATRIDPATDARTQYAAPAGAPLTGAAGDGSSIWLLVNQPQTLLHWTPVTTSSSTPMRPPPRGPSAHSWPRGGWPSVRAGSGRRTRTRTSSPAATAPRVP
jgi:YVTN family beta-propeller protein